LLSNLGQKTLGGKKFPGGGTPIGSKGEKSRVAKVGYLNKEKGHSANEELTKKGRFRGYREAPEILFKIVFRGLKVVCPTVNHFTRSAEC